MIASLAVAAGCAITSQEDASNDQAPIRELERRAVGRAQEYSAQTFTADDEALFSKSKKARRELGWKIFEKVLQPVPIAAQPSTAGATDAKRTIPLFRTWLGGDELERMFVKMYGDLGKERRLAKDVPTDKEVAALFDWNATSLGPNSDADFFARMTQVTNQQAVDGLAGNARVAYSPGYVRQYLTDFPAMAGCEGKMTTFSPTSAPASDDNFTNCLSHEFEKSAAVVKASWRRNDEVVNEGLPVADTSAATLKKRLARELDDGGWPQKNLPMHKAGPEDAYTVELSTGPRYSLQGLHIITKELRHWVWITLWWSPDADSDFGQDRPESIKKLGGPWGNYKMCVVTDYNELDPDPRGGFDGSLGDALAATHGSSTWCSNAFIEKGTHNAETNCIGCHQHAGDVSILSKVLSDDPALPLSGRTKVRKAFPVDYTWAFATPDSPDQKDRFQQSILKRMRAYAQSDSE